MELDELRKEISDIDKELFDCFTRRMHAVDEIARVKKEKNLPLFHAGREKDLLERLSHLVPPEYYSYALTLYKNAMELSKSRQRELYGFGLGVDSEFSRMILSSLPELASPRVTVQGVVGSYAMAAAKTMYPNAQLTHVETWDDVLTAVSDGSCDYGVLPLENSSAGSVVDVYDLLFRTKHYIVKALPLPVRHCLLGTRGAKISDIRKVFSHPHAFPQCDEYLKNNHRMRTSPCLNTAVAAEYVAHEGKKEYAAIASKECAHIYGLDILAEGVQNSNANVTRFVSVSKRLEIPANANKISLAFTLPHVTGSLYRTLARFAHQGLNLTKIESRPHSDRNFEYYFYMDFSGSVRSTAVLDLLSSLSEELPTFCFLGNYNEP